MCVLKNKCDFQNVRFSRIKLTLNVEKIGSDNHDLSLVLPVSLAMHRFFRYNLKGGNRHMVMYQCIHHTCILQTILLMLKIFQLISNYSAQSEQLSFRPAICHIWRNQVSALGTRRIIGLRILVYVVAHCCGQLVCDKPARGLVESSSTSKSISRNTMHRQS